MEKERKSEIINTYKRHDGDTGSAEVQIALLTERMEIFASERSAASSIRRTAQRATIDILPHIIKKSNRFNAIA